MNSYQVQSPIIFLTFNRPETTKKVFEQIRKVKPTRLLFVSDGPRKNHPTDKANVDQVRSLISQVDWPCKIETNFAEENMGCKMRVSSGITWAFQQVPEAIILEDDCLPDPSFFKYCDTLLNHYRNDTRIMHIGGVNFQNGIKRGDGSYYFSNYYPIWGWATWSRAWKHYDRDLKKLPSFVESKKIESIIPSKRVQKIWLGEFQGVADGKIDTWDYQWTFAVWNQGGISAIPNKNLISNIGFGEASVHTKDKGNKFASMKTENLGEIKHPSTVEVNIDADELINKTFLSPSIYERVVSKIKKVMKR